MLANVPYPKGAISLRSSEGGFLTSEKVLSDTKIREFSLDEQPQLTPEQNQSYLRLAREYRQHEPNAQYSDGRHAAAIFKKRKFKAGSKSNDGPVIEEIPSDSDWAVSFYLFLLNAFYLMIM